MIWLGAVALIAGAVVTLRATDDVHSSDTDGDDRTRPVEIERFADANVVLPVPGGKPAAPSAVAVAPESGALRVSWADAVPGGRAPDGAAGYEVRWRQAGGEWRTRLVVTPDVRLARLTDGRRYEIEVRTVDAFGQRSRAATGSGTPARARPPWRAALTGLYDDFADPGRWPEKWHLSGYRGCVDVVSERGNGLPIELGCGADLAVLRARAPMTLTPARPGLDTELGRVAVSTDTAGTGGELTVTLAPGPVDRVGLDTQRAESFAPRDPALPGGTIRVGVAHEGVFVSAAPDVPSVPTPATPPRRPAARGPGASHLFEVVLRMSGLYVYQDGQLVATAGLRPSWTSASVMLGFRGPERRRSRVHLTGAGYSGPATTPPTTIEVPINAGTQRVLGPAEQAPQLGIARGMLAGATSARLVTTMMIVAGMDPRGVVAQFGDVLVPAAPVVASPSSADGAALTVAATLPPALLTANGSTSITPFVMRAPGANQQVRLVETYLEVTPGPGWDADGVQAIRPARPTRDDMMPAVDAKLSDASGKPLTSTVVPRSGQAILTVTLDASGSQWETGSIRGVQGFQVWRDGRLIAAVPTRVDGPGLGGRYVLAITTSGMAVGGHTFDVREYTMSGTERPVSALLNFTVR